MGIFSSIMDKIFHHAPARSAAPTAPAAVPLAPAAQPAPPATAPPQVDVEGVLTAMAGMNDGGGNWRTSIVDLLKLLQLDASLSARKELATELGVRAGDDGSAEQNIALHKGVMQKLAENGGLVPDSLRN
jgi:hypothetical protein